MLLSTSSSSERVPQGAWLSTWLAALTICAVIVAGWEYFVRVRGLSDTAVADSAELWIRERERASLLGSEAIMLVGASRIQMGVDPGVLGEYTRGTPVQLAMSASPFLPVLEHLANDETITGTLIVSFTARDLLWFSRESRAEQWIVAYDEYRSGKTSVFYQALEDKLGNAVNSILLTFRKDARPQQLIFGRTTRNYVRTLPDRSQQADYSKVDRELAYQRRIELVRGAEEPVFKEIPDLDQRLAALEAMVERIHQRGGKVIFVRLPSSKRIREIEETRHPKEIYWDRFAAQTSARTIHYADFPQLSRFDLPDGVHLDASDQPAFTRALAQIIFGGPEQ